MPADGVFQRHKAAVVLETVKEREISLEYWSNYEDTEMSFGDMEVCWNVKLAELTVRGICLYKQ